MRSGDAEEELGVDGGRAGEGGHPSVVVDGAVDGAAGVVVCGHRLASVGELGVWNGTQS